MSATTAPTRAAEIGALISRAASLRAGATTMTGPLEVAYRRRAAELELEATALAARLGIDEPVPAAA